VEEPLPAPPLVPLPAAGYSFEPELTGPPPRPLPDRLEQGPYVRRRRAVAVAAAASGLACLLLSHAPGVDTLALYVLPLGYLDWIGAALLLTAAGVYLSLVLHTGPFRYVRDGLTLPVHIVALTKRATVLHDGVPSTHALFATVTFRRPETGETTVAEVRSADFSSSRKDSYDAPFKVGDDATAVYFPGRLEETLRLYAFLDLSPDVNLTARKRPDEGSSGWKLALLLTVVPVIFIVLFANVYAFGRYRPLHSGHQAPIVPLVLGAVVIGGGMFAGLYLSHRSEQRKIQARSVQAMLEGTAVELSTPFLGHGLQGWVVRVLVALGMPLLGACTGMCWAFMGNAWLDRSPAQPVPAVVESRVMKTHAFIFREYELEYRVEGVSKRLSLLTTPAQLARFHTPRAVARVRAGAFGWPWVEGVDPAPD